MSKPENSAQFMWGHDSERLLLLYTSLKREIQDRPLSSSNMPHIFAQSVRLLRAAGASIWLDDRFPDGLLGIAGFGGQEHKAPFSF